MPISARTRQPTEVEDHASTRDAGMSLIEILIAVVLLGTVVVATLTALRVTVIGTAVERDHARAHQWLQSATGVLQAAPRASCQSTEQQMRDHYIEALTDEDTGAQTPEGWGDWQMTVLYPVQVWDGSRYWNPEDTGAPATCFEPLFLLQLVTIQVVSPDGQIIENRQVVKGD